VVVDRAGKYQMAMVLVAAGQAGIEPLQVWLLHRELHIQLQLVLVGPEVLIRALLVFKVQILYLVALPQPAVVTVAAVCLMILPITAARVVLVAVAVAITPLEPEEQEL